MVLKKFSIIACINKQRALGKNNQLLYHIKEDLQNFRRVTTNNVVIMGRKTFESLPNKKPLPNRINIVITRDLGYKIEGDNIYVLHGIDEVVELCETKFPEKDWFVIGGASIYTLFFNQDLIGKAYITEVDDNTVGDAYLTNFDETNWRTITKSEGLTNGKHTYSYTLYSKKYF